MREETKSFGTLDFNQSIDYILVMRETGKHSTGSNGETKLSAPARLGVRSRRRPARERSSDTPAALVNAALKLFADQGYSATSTRQIAAAAGVNISLISYYFGGKAGLRLACAHAIARRIGEVAGSVLLGATAENPQAAAAALNAALTTMIRFLLAGDESRSLIGFVLRELSDPGPAFEVLYEELFFPIHKAACQLWGKATGNDPESEATRLAVFAMVGQAVYFRIAKPLIERRLGWKEMGEKELAAVRSVIESNIRAGLDVAQRRPR